MLLFHLQLTCRTRSCFSTLFIMQSTAIPVIILTGFLGSGKTTLLNHLLRHNNGQKIGVIVNDFGEVNIDALLVSRQTENTMELSGGCICCQVGDGDLEESLSMFAHPGTTTDVIIIEASGIAEPVDLKKLILYSPNKDIRFGGVVYVVDAANIQATIKTHPEIGQHIGAADLLVLNKTDLVSKKQLKDVCNLLARHNSHAPVIQTTQGIIHSELLFDQNPHDEKQLKLMNPLEDDHHSHLHDSFSSLTFHSNKPLSPKRFAHFLAHMPQNIYRMKAILYYGMKGFEQKVVLQKVGNHTTQYAEEWPNHEQPASDIVVIGVDIDADAINRQLTDCIDPTPDEITADDMIDIMRLKGF